MAYALVEAIEGGFEVGAGLGEDLTDAADGEFDCRDGVGDDPTRVCSKERSHHSEFEPGDIGEACGVPWGIEDEFHFDFVDAR